MNTIANTYLLSMLSGLPIRATVGTEASNLGDVFTAGLHGEILPHSEEKPTPATRATLSKIIEDRVRFAEIFGSLGEERRRWTKSQMAVYSRYYPNLFESDGHATLFELEGGFVATVFLTLRNRFGAYYYPFLSDVRWYTEHLRVASLE